MIHLLFLTVLTFVQLNCENLFDCRHDSLKEDTEYTPDGKRQWNRDRYWNKIKNITQELAGCCGKDTLPDLITLCEIENDSVMNDLTRRALLSRLGYRYIMTSSKDKRGIDVALLYNVMSFKPINHRSVTPDDNNDTHPLRDLLYVSGRITSGDTLHVIVVHAPSSTILPKAFLCPTLKNRDYSTPPNMPKAATEHKAHISTRASGKASTISL